MRPAAATPVEKLNVPEPLFLARLADCPPDLVHSAELAISFVAIVQKGPDPEGDAALEAWLADARGTAFNPFVRSIYRDRMPSL